MPTISPSPLPPSPPATDPAQGQSPLDQAFAPFRRRMEDAGCSEAAILAFRRHYAQLWAGETGYITAAEAGPVERLPELDDLAVDAGSSLGAPDLKSLAIIKLNGGLGTSMGLSGPKSLLPVHDGLSFLDITARQVLSLRARSGARLPLLLMNSFHTDGPSLRALEAYPELGGEGSLPARFLQGQVPKVNAADLSPADWPADPGKAWCPPGHGEVYTALWSSGLLGRLLTEGFELAFISNIDNLGATVDPAIPALMARQGSPFLMEVTRRTAADRKGGHLARGSDGRLLLRELAQCPPQELEAFQDIERFGYFNTNSIWVHLPTLSDLLQSRQGSLDLPLIRNRKPMDPALPSSPPVYQLESAMGAAIQAFTAAMALSVPRSRFRPVKKCSDLVGLWSDAYAIDGAGQLLLRAERRGRPPEVDLDDDHYGRLADVELRLPHGAPSLLACDRLTVRGDVRFGRDIRLAGEVTLLAGPGEVLTLADGTRIDG